ncbi:MAG: DUF6659 family protein [Nitrosotalea sp.]
MENNIEQLENICRKVLEVDPSFRFVGIINDKGKLIAGGLKKDVKILMDEKEAEMVHTEVALMMRMRREHDPHLGPVNFAISHREKVVLMGFPVGEDILYISSTNEIDWGKVPFRILQILRSEFN